MLSVAADTESEIEGLEGLLDGLLASGEDEPAAPAPATIDDARLLMSTGPLLSPAVDTEDCRLSPVAGLEGLEDDRTGFSSTLSTELRLLLPKPGFSRS